MKRLIIFLTLFLVITNPVFAKIYTSIVGNNWHITGADLSNCTGLSGNTGFSSGTETNGKTWYVYSGAVGAGTGTDWLNAVTTIDAGINLVSAGDVLKIDSRHAGSGSLAGFITADVNNITIEGLGSGTDMPTVTYTGTVATTVIGAADITIKRIRFVAGISNIPIGISVLDAGDGFTMENCLFSKPDTNTFDFADMVDLASGADRITIAYNEFYTDDGGADTDSDHVVEMGNGTNSNVKIVGNIMNGDWLVSAIWSDTADQEIYIANNAILNTATGQHCIEFTSTAVGWVINNALYGDTEGSILDSGSMFTANNAKSVLIDLDAIPLWVIDNGLNHLLAIDGTAAYPEQGATDSILAKLMCSGAAATFNTYTNTTDSLQAISDILWGGAGIAAFPTAAAYTNDVSIAEVLAYIQDAVRNGSGVGLPANKSLFDIIGETYTDDGGGDHLDDVYAHLNLVMKYTADGTGGGAAAGASLPAGKSLFDIMGDEYTDDGGDDNLDSIAAHLNLMSKYIADGDGDFATGTPFASNKSIADGIGTDGATLADDAVSIAGIIGIPTDADHAVDSTNTTANANGSLYERAEDIANKVDGTTLVPGREYVTTWNETLFVSDDAWEVLGGPILITSLVGQITTAYDGALTRTWWCDATTAAQDIEFTDSVDIDAYLIGERIIYTNANPALHANLTAGATNGGGSVLMSPWYCPIGTIEVLVEGPAAAAGAITWYMTYIPLTAGITVTAQ